MCSDFFYHDHTQEKQTPTVLPATMFEPLFDAETLKNALKDDVNEDAIINVLTRRSVRQRLEIAAEFKKLYGKDLVCELEDELSGDFKKLMIALMTPPAEFLAREIHNAISGIGTNEKTLVEILCTATNLQINDIKKAYNNMYENSLEEDLTDDTSGSFQRLLVSLLRARRSETEKINEELVNQDVSNLIAVGLGSKSGDEESVFNTILCTRSYTHLRKVFQRYHEIAQITLKEVVEDEFSGDVKKGMLAIMHSMERKPIYFAERLHDAMACLGTKDRQLIRIIVSRCEVDMQEIKEEYKKMYNKTLEEDIADDTSGNYKKALLSLVEGE